MAFEMERGNRRNLFAGCVFLSIFCTLYYFIVPEGEFSGKGNFERILNRKEREKCPENGSSKNAEKICTIILIFVQNQKQKVVFQNQAGSGSTYGGIGPQTPSFFFDSTC